MVHPADVQDRDGARLVLDRRTRCLFPFIERIFADAGYQGPRVARTAGVALYNRPVERTDDLVREFGHERRFTPTKDLKAFVAALAKPRVVIIMVQAGKPVDDVIEELLPYLEADDIVIDGGNSLFTDTDRRFTSPKQKKIRFIGMGMGEKPSALARSWNAVI